VRPTVRSSNGRASLMLDRVSFRLDSSVAILVTVSLAALTCGSALVSGYGGHVRPACAQCPIPYFSRGSMPDRPHRLREPCALDNKACLLSYRCQQPCRSSAERASSSA